MKIQKLIELLEQEYPLVSLYACYTTHGGVSVSQDIHNLLPILRAAERMAEALKFYAGLKDGGEWADHVCDSYSGQTHTFDWNGEIQDEPDEVAKTALAEWEKVNQ